VQPGKYLREGWELFKQNSGGFIGFALLLIIIHVVLNYLPVIGGLVSLAISAPIPNDTLSFGPDFPAELRQEILDALFALAENKEAWDATALQTAYSWTGIEPIEDSVFNSVRLQFEILGLTEEDIFG